MRLTTQALGALATAGILAVTLPGVAYAVPASGAAHAVPASGTAYAQPTAAGTVYAGKRKYVRPTVGRCYDYRNTPIKNATNKTLYIYRDDECELDETVAIYKGAYVLRAPGRSFRLL